MTRIAPRPLSLDAIRSLAAGSRADAAEVARVTRGNPFLVVEALAAGGTLPASVRDATLARVARLGTTARELVNVAAVTGERVSPELLDELVAYRDTATAVAALSSPGPVIRIAEHAGWGAVRADMEVFLAAHVRPDGTYAIHNPFRYAMRRPSVEEDRPQPAAPRISRQPHVQASSATGRHRRELPLSALSSAG